MSGLFQFRLFVCAAPLLFAPAGAFAQSAIGGAAIVVKDVRGEISGKRARISLGDRIFADQNVQTAAESMAKFVFLDDTNMTLGPDSRAKLDSFVFDANGAGKNISVSATKGAFRFVSGKSPSESYKVTTPHAHIGVRGTTYDVRVQNGRTLVVLQHGAVNVCLRNSARCRELTQPGQSLVVTDNDIAGPISPSNKPWDFGDLCAGRPGDLCGTSQFAQLPDAPTRRAESAPKPERKMAPPQRRAANTAPPPKTRPVREARTIIIDDEDPMPVGRPNPILVGVGVALPALVGGVRPRPGPGWRPPGALPPSSGRRPVEQRQPKQAQPKQDPRVGYIR